MLRKGPIFTNILLADEINRASPKTQSALLEAMQEYQVTLEGETLTLPDPFIVIATQNPIEYEGTFPLPEAQLGPVHGQTIHRLSQLRKKKMRFCDGGLTEKQTSSRSRLSSRPRPFWLCGQRSKGVYVDPDVRRYMVDLAAKSRSHRQVAVGVSPRGSLALLKLSRAWAAIHGRSFVIPDDIKQFIQPALAHRIILDPSLWDVRKSENKIMEEVAQSVPVPVLKPDNE